MRKLLRTILLLPCFLILYSNNINVVSQVDAWATGHTFEENIKDADSNDSDGTLVKTILFTTSFLFPEKELYFEKNINKIRLAHTFIRAPPTYLL